MNNISIFLLSLQQKRKMKNIFGKAMLLATALLFSITGTSCSSDDSPVPEKEKTYDMSGFAKGAFDNSGKPTAVFDAYK